MHENFACGSVTPAQENTIPCASHFKIDKFFTCTYKDNYKTI